MLIGPAPFLMMKKGQRERKGEIILNGGNEGSSVAPEEGFDEDCRLLPASTVPDLPEP